MNILCKIGSHRYEKAHRGGSSFTGGVCLRNGCDSQYWLENCPPHRIINGHISEETADEIAGIQLNDILEMEYQLQIKHDDGVWRAAHGLFVKSYLKEMWLAGRVRRVMVRDVS